ncbi:tail fiber protein [Ralstonia phage RSJ5]|uniref:Putative phage tail fiber protein n=1 Tax=Ralstonia phage RSJ5 TaxID=1538364 RepID=A0A077KRY2_9CAUD|nr:tail fiber protein [Ralstonia phage RSJ5]BAP34930.1 putative phage tail fiber protein [Ralstonia phage RSJ5]
MPFGALISVAQKTHKTGATMADVIITPWIDAGDPNGLKYSMNRFQCDGVANVFSINFAGVAPGYLDRGHIKFYVITAADGTKTDAAVVPSGAFQSDTHIKLEATPGVPYPTGKWVVIYRDTPKSQPIVNFTDGAVINEENLDTSSEQGVYVAAEMTDRFEEILGSNYEVIDRAAEALATANEALDSAAAANVTAGNAVTSAGAANATAAAAVDSAAAANTTAGNAVTTANGATTTANTAKATADGLAASIATANTNASNAVSTANTALTTANGIDAKAQQALDASDGRYNGNSAIVVYNGAGEEWSAGLSIKKGTRAAPGTTKWYAGSDAADTQNFALARYSAAGAYVDTPIKVLYSDGTIAIGSKRVTGMADPTGNQDGATKNYADTRDALRVAKTGDTMSGTLNVGGVTNSGAFQCTADVGGGWVDWNGSRKFAVQVDCPNQAAAYGGMRWTAWGQRHIAAIEAFGNSGGQPSIVFQLADQGNAWTFNSDNITRAKGGYVWGSWNINPAAADWISTVGIEANDLDKPYVRRASDSGIRRMPYVASNNTVGIYWDGTYLRGLVDRSRDCGLWDTGSAPNVYRMFYSGDSRVAQSWRVGNSYMIITVDGTDYAINFVPSDERVKRNIVPSPVSALDKLDKVDLYSFQFKEGFPMNPDEKHEVGFLAQQLKAIDPTWVQGGDSKEGPTQPGEEPLTSIMSPNHLPILATAVKAIKELRAQVDELKAELAALKGA